MLPTRRQLRELDAYGVIIGYRAIVDPRLLGLGSEVPAIVTMRQEDRATLLEFEEAAAAIQNVLQAPRLFGEPDDLLRVRTKGLTPARNSRMTYLPHCPACSG